MEMCIRTALPGLRLPGLPGGRENCEIPAIRSVPILPGCPTALVGIFEKVKCDLSEDSRAMFYFSDGVIDLKASVERDLFRKTLT